MHLSEGIKKPSYTTNEYYFDISNENINGENSYLFKYLSSLPKVSLEKVNSSFTKMGHVKTKKIKCCQYIPKKKQM